MSPNAIQRRLAAAKYVRLFFPAVGLMLCAISFLSSPPSTAHAGIVGSGNVDPANPASWTRNTLYGYIGRASVGTVLVDGGSDLSCDTGVLGLSAGANGTVTVRGAGSTFVTTWVYDGYYGSGTINIEAGGLVSDLTGYLGYGLHTQGTATVSGAGSMWINNRDFYVGNSGNGTLRIEAGGQVSNTVACLGLSTGSTGAATVTGVGSTWTSNSVLYIGNFGSGLLYVEAGGHIVNIGTTLGYNAGSVGTATITGVGTTWTNKYSLYVGESGKGTLNIEAGAQVSSATGYVAYGNGTGATSTATVTGAGSKWTNSGDFGVGYYGNAILTISAGGQVTSGESSVGRRYLSSDSTKGVATVTGIGSNWTSSGNLHVGEADIGILNIEMGGQVSNAKCYLSRLGTVKVADAGSKWTNNGELNVDGKLNVEAGGLVTSTLGYVYSDSSGTVTVTGAGSQWTNSLTLTIAGTLNIAAGGQVSNTDGNVSTGYGSNGNATVTGAGSMWTNRGNLYVGCIAPYAAGTLNVFSGGQVNSVNGYVGRVSYTSLATVSGKDSMWTNSSTLYIGDQNGIGVLKIEAGGQVIDATGYLGANGSTGTATVNGAGSRWINSSELIVGESGRGTLTIGGGTVQARTLTLAKDQYGSGTCNLISGGTIQAATINRGPGTASFTWNDGTIRNYDANTDLTVGLSLRLAATGTHAFQVDPNRTANVVSVLCDASVNGTLAKTGAGTLTLSAANTYSGATTISDGTLRLSSSGSLASNPINIGSTAIFDVLAKNGYHLVAGKTLQGSGKVIGALLIDGGAIHAPGNSLGIQIVQGSYTMNGNMKADVQGSLAGSGYDQVLISDNFARSVTLGGTLSILWGGSNWSSDAGRLWIIENDTAGSLDGTFSNYAANGAWVGNYDGRDWRLFYGADSATGATTGGNDVLLAAVPEPDAIFLLAAAMLGLLGYARRRKGREQSKGVFDGKQETDNAK